MVAPSLSAVLASVLIVILALGFLDHGLTGKLLLFSPQAAFGQLSQSSGAQNVDFESRFYYGCTKYVPNFHCDPIVNKFDSVRAPANYIKVANITGQPNFINVATGSAIELRANALAFVTVENSPALRSNAFSIDVLLRPDNTENLLGSVVSFVNAPLTAGWRLDLLPSSDPSTEILSFTVYNTEGKGFTTSQVTVPANKFIRVTGTFDNEKVRIYIDGSLQSEVDFVGTFNPNPGAAIPLKFGASAYCSCGTISVTLDEARYYTRALGAEEVSSAHSTVAAGLVSQWKFDGDLKDATDNHFDASYKSLVAGMVFTPDGRLLFTEKNSGLIRVLDANGKLVDRPFAIFTDIYVHWEMGLLSIALDAKYEENHYVYVTYNYQEGLENQIFMRLIRLTDKDGIGVDPKVIVDKIPASVGFHTGGAIAFNKADDKLYLTIGDGTKHAQAQDLTTLYGKLLRVNRDGTIPSDNPFPGSSIYTYGHRNAYGIAFDPNGQGILAESGATLYDEVNLVKPGGNYGFPTLQLQDTPPEAANSTTSIKPLRSYWQTPTPTQTEYYEDDVFPELNGSFVWGTVRGDIYSTRLDKQTEQLTQEAKIDLEFYPYAPVVALAISPSGEIYFAGYDIYRLGTIDWANAEEHMYPVEVNTKNINVTGIEFNQARQKLTVNLEDQQQESALLIKFSQAMLNETIWVPSELISEVAIANDNATTIDLPHKLTGIAGSDEATILLELPADYASTDALQLIVTSHNIAVTKTVPEFGSASIAVLLVSSTVALAVIRARGGPWK
jgi:glucose/arabinose dehydrogenase